MGRPGSETSVLGVAPCKNFPVWTTHFPENLSRQSLQISGEISGNFCNFLTKKVGAGPTHIQQAREIENLSIDLGRTVALSLE